MPEENPTTEECGVIEDVPSKLERRKTLETALTNRPDPKDLLDRNILIGTGAPTVQQHQKELEHKMAQDKLKHGLENRANREQLEERQILYPEGQAPPDHQKEKEELTDFLKNRPTGDDLVKKGILSEGEIEA